MLTITVQTDNSAFGETNIELREELSRILNSIPEKIDLHASPQYGSLCDLNGNTVCEWSYVKPPVCLICESALDEDFICLTCEINNMEDEAEQSCKTCIQGISEGGDFVPYGNTSVQTPEYYLCDSIEFSEEDREHYNSEEINGKNCPYFECRSTLI